MFTSLQECFSPWMVLTIDLCSRAYLATYSWLAQVWGWHAADTTGVKVTDAVKDAQHTIPLQCQQTGWEQTPIWWAPNAQQVRAGLCRAPQGWKAHASSKEQSSLLSLKFKIEYYPCSTWEALFVGLRHSIPFPFYDNSPANFLLL